ncbi:hypothetical protein HY090_00370, partial [Candidatus Kaiserbacteria bacterium]|nr:hypothetical protein [Candidatus Kaiserbacteria bacterium]
MPQAGSGRFLTFAAIVFLPLALFVFPSVARADYASLQGNDCTLLQEFSGPDGHETLVNATSSCAGYIPVATTSPAKIDVFGKCTNGDIYNSRFDVFTYDGIRGHEVGGSVEYKEGENFPLFTCDNIDRNVDGLITIPPGTSQSFFVAVSSTIDASQVKDLFENGIGAGNFPYALVHFDIKANQAAASGITAPVIIIPGILGSARLLNGQWAIDPIAHIYDNLIDTLVANGYQKDTTLFTFPYQWRDSNVDTALLLEQKIADVKA